MSIAFFGLYGSFDFYHIGGTDSITRRLGFELIRRGEDVAFVHFDAPKDRLEVTSEGLSLNYYSTFEDSLRFLAERCDHVVTIYIPRKLRLAYARFRKREAQRARFHFLYFGWPESRLKRELLFLEARRAPYNGNLFCVSPRQFETVSRWSERAQLLLPPVPDEHFLRPEDKPNHERIRVVYMGRIDPGKGAPDAISFFEYLQHYPEFETRIYGFPWMHDPETVQLHQQLLAQDDFFYEPTNFENYSPAVDVNVRCILRETDILFLPYCKLSSTIDTPLLLLEGMAHLCAVVTRPLGNLAEIYGTDQWMSADLTNYEGLLNLFRELGERLPYERERLVKWNRELKYSVQDIADQFYTSIQDA